ncbi:MAG: N-6 DNA methylase [Candidatus Lokiarchaeota archaeon]|nr:N-6 DNA methylase [Candidatus Lokiarchaeota archaeon]
MEIDQILYEIYTNPKWTEEERNAKLFSQIYPQFLNKNLGSFFTPPDIAVKLTENCFNDKKVEDLLNIKILDPACGLGEFLIAAANYVLSVILAGKIISDNEEVKIRKKIVHNCLYGFDINNKTVELCRLRLVYWSLNPLHKKNPFSLSVIKNECHNLLQTIQYANFFDIYDPDKKYDVILCNPPYNAFIETAHLKRMRKLYPSIIQNSAAYFFLLCKALLKKKGKMGFILPKSLAYSRRWNSLKICILRDLIFIQDISKAFNKVKLEQILLVTGKDASRTHYITETNEGSRISIEKTEKIKKNSLILSLTHQEYLLYQDLQIHKKTLESCIKAYRGLNIQNQAKTINRYQNNFLFCIEGKLIGQFHIKPIRKGICRSILDGKTTFLGEILGQLANAHVKKPVPHYKLVFSRRPPSGKYVCFDTVVNIFLKELKKPLTNEFLRVYLLCYLNSKLFAWYLYKIVYAGAIRSTRLDFIYLKQVPYYCVPKNDETTYRLFHFLSNSLSYMGFQSTNSDLYQKLYTLLNGVMVLLYLSISEYNEWIQSIQVNWEGIYNFSVMLDSHIQQILTETPSLNIHRTDIANNSFHEQISTYLSTLWNHRFIQILKGIKKNERICNLI